MAEAESWRKRVDEGAFGACFLNVFGTLEEIPLFSIGLSQERHDAYVRRLEHLGATPSPLTLNINKWTKICYADPRAEEVLRNVSEGMQVDFNTPPPKSSEASGLVRKPRVSASDVGNLNPAVCLSR